MHAPETHHDSLGAARDPAGARHWGYRRIIWHAIGLVMAALLAWLLLRAYRQPDFMIDMVNLMLC